MNARNEQFAVVTGASRGIGFEIARCFAKDGYPLVIAADHGPRLQEAKQALTAAGAPRVEIAVVDLSKPEGPQVLFDDVEKLGVTPEFLVNNAGFVVYGDFTRESDWASELRMIQLNVISVAHITKLFAPAMVERGSGKILITASIASLAPTPLTAVYGATKAFDYSFAQALANELKDTGVTVTALLPGATDTNIFNRADMEDTGVGKGSKADPADVAKAGYDAMMQGSSHVISPFGTRVSAALVSVLPPSLVTSVARSFG